MCDIQSKELTLHFELQENQDLVAEIIFQLTVNNE